MLICSLRISNRARSEGSQRLKTLTYCRSCWLRRTAPSNNIKIMIDVEIAYKGNENTAGPGTRSHRPSIVLWLVRLRRSSTLCKHPTRCLFRRLLSLRSTPWRLLSSSGYWRQWLDHSQGFSQSSSHLRLIRKLTGLPMILDAFMGVFDHFEAHRPKLQAEGGGWKKP